MTSRQGGRGHTPSLAKVEASEREKGAFQRPRAGHTNSNVAGHGQRRVGLVA